MVVVAVVVVVVVAVVVVLKPAGVVVVVVAVVVVALTTVGLVGVEEGGEGGLASVGVSAYASPNSRFSWKTPTKLSAPSCVLLTPTMPLLSDSSTRGFTSTMPSTVSF